MPPRYVFWTILIDRKPTAFRAREREELLPTLQQLRRTNKDVVLKWFAHGRLWDSRDEERDAWQRRKPVDEKRGRDWRPGGAHKDPRGRFKKGSRPLLGAQLSRDRPWKKAHGREDDLKRRTEPPREPATRTTRRP